MKVVWTETAIAHLRSIHAYIAQDSVRYAQATVDRLTRRSQQIGRDPLSGGKVPEYDNEEIRELIESPYRLIYRIRTGQLDVIAVVHGARQLPADLT